MRYGEQYKNNFSRNVIAKIEGADPSLKAEYVIAGGHLDHNGMTNGIVYNGADDNASGSATTMEVARLLAVNQVKPKRTLIFALWAGEEQGLIGSQYYSDNPTDGVSMDKTTAYFNMDMVGLGDRIGAPGALNFPSIFGVIMKDQDPEIAKKVDPSQSGPGGSDHSAFIERGIEALALMTSGRGGHPDYHDSGDDPAKMEADVLGWTGQFVLQGMLNLANETSVNLLIPGPPGSVPVAALRAARHFRRNRAQLAARAGDDQRRTDGPHGPALPHAVGHAAGRVRRGGRPRAAAAGAWPRACAAPGSSRAAWPRSRRPRRPSTSAAWTSRGPTAPGSATR